MAWIETFGSATEVGVPLMEVLVRKSALILASFAVVVSAGAGAKERKKSDSQVETGDQTRVICRTADETGSRLRKVRTCRTAQEWAERKRIDRMEIESMQGDRTKAN